MKFDILKIILWPKNHNMKIRIVEFETGKINIITGKSQTGKSSIIPIIDYCLGSGKCTIPVGIIRNKTEWFGLLIQLENTQLLLARPEPGYKLQASEMYMYESENIRVIDRPYKTCDVEAVKQRLNEHAGLTSLNFLGEDMKSTFSSRPSFRDMSAFEFQPQHIVANPYTLFFKADTYEHQEKLKVIFPFLLGAIDNSTLVIQRDLRDLEKELDVKKRELDLRKKAMITWLSEIKAYYSQAIELGLLPGAPDAQRDWTIDYYLKRLQAVPKVLENYKSPIVIEGSTERAVKELVALREEEEMLSREINLRKLKLVKYERLYESERNYVQSLDIQQERVECIDWFEEKIKSYNGCPFCGSNNTAAEKEITNLMKVSEGIQRISRKVHNSFEVLDKEIADVKGQLKDLERNINVVRKHREILEQKSSTLAENKHVLSEVYRFVGRLEQSLENINVVDEGDIINSIKELEVKIENLRVLLDEQSVENRKNYALNKISKLISKYAEIIGVERPEDMVKLDIKNLTIKVESHERGSDYLWEIGSGANWMGYHICTLLALGEFFTSVQNSPVPHFLVIDQPSQVYFPEQWPEDIEGLDNNVNAIKSDDIDRVNKIFRTLSKCMDDSKGKVQIIIIDHADEITWKDVGNIKLVERWRGSNALIQNDWLE